MSARPRNRKILLLIGLCFAAPMLVSLILTRAGWMPSGRKNYGELLSSPMPLINAPLIDGTIFMWKTPEWYWTLLVRVPNDCIAACREQLDLIPNLRDALARDATKLRIAIADPLPEGALLRQEHGVYRLAEPIDTSVNNALLKPSGFPRLVLVDPNGYVIMRYPEQADLSKVRKDLAKLLK
jgi:hypothetical protein